MRYLKQLLKKQPNLAPSIQTVIDLLTSDPFHESLSTHKLKGEYKGSWACSVAYDLRIVFQFQKRTEPGLEDDIALIKIGTHDEVY